MGDSIKKRVNVTIEWVKRNTLHSTEGVSFTFYDFGIINDVWPDWGPCSGGTVIEVRGEKLLEGATCHLKNIETVEVIKVPAFPVNEGLYLCETFSHKPGIFEVNLEYGNEAYVEKSGFTFEFAPDPHIYRLDPY
jgi:hypothetical protein